MTDCYFILFRYIYFIQYLLVYKFETKIVPNLISLETFMVDPGGDIFVDERFHLLRLRDKF